MASPSFSSEKILKMKWQKCNSEMWEAKPYKKNAIAIEKRTEVLWLS